MSSSLRLPHRISLGQPVVPGLLGMPPPTLPGAASPQTLGPAAGALSAALKAVTQGPILIGILGAAWELLLTPQSSPLPPAPLKLKLSPKLFPPPWGRSQLHSLCALMSQHRPGEEAGVQGSFRNAENVLTPPGGESRPLCKEPKLLTAVKTERFTFVGH